MFAVAIGVRMKITKIILSLSLLSALMLSLCTCGIPSPTAEFTTLDTSALGEVSMISCESNEKYSVLFYMNYTEEWDEDTNGTADDIHYYISVFDNKKNKEIGKTQLKNKENYGYEVRLTDEGFSLFSIENDEVINYDFKLKNYQTENYDFKENYDTAKGIQSIDPDKFNCLDTFAISHGYRSNQALVFYDESDKLFILKSNLYYDYLCADKHKILVIDNSANKTDNYESVVRILDFDSNTEINSITIPNEQNINNIQCAKLNGECATVATVKEDGRLDKVYIWNYNLNPKNKPFDNGFCEAVADDKITEKTDEAVKRIKGSYDIGLEYAPDLNFIRQEYVVNNDLKPIEFYLSVLDLEQYIAILPRQFYKELLCTDIELPLSTGFEQFRIYLVGDFPENDISAFANNISCDETDNMDTLYIVYSCSGLNQKTFFHELMHSMEYRIWNYESTFDENWASLNPPQFEYSEDYPSLYYDESHSDWQDYFSRDYGMKNILEDRATCFEEMCDGLLTDNCWWKEKTPLLKKEKYLSEIIKKSFSSLNNSKIILHYQSGGAIALT